MTGAAPARVIPLLVFLSLYARMRVCTVLTGKTCSTWLGGKQTSAAMPYARAFSGQAEVAWPRFPRI